MPLLRQLLLFIHWRWHRLFLRNVPKSWTDGLRIHKEYLQKMRSCEFEQDPVACFNVSLYKKFEKHFKSWHDGGIITIHLPQNRVVSLSKRPLFSVMVSEKQQTGSHTCERCLAAFSGLDELERHYEKEQQHPPLKASKDIPSRGNQISRILYFEKPYHYRAGTYGYNIQTRRAKSRKRNQKSNVGTHITLVFIIVESFLRCDILTLM